MTELSQGRAACPVGPRFPTPRCSNTPGRESEGKALGAQALGRGLKYSKCGPLSALQHPCPMQNFSIRICTLTRPQAKQVLIKGPQALPSHQSQSKEVHLYPGPSSSPTASGGLCWVHFFSALSSLSLLGAVVWTGA